MPRKWIGAALVGLTALGACLRFYRLNVLPPGLFGDEALVTLHARQAVSTGNFPIYFAQIDGGFHPAVVYLTMLARWMTNNHPYAIRFGIATIGVLNIPLAFFTLRSVLQLSYPTERSEVGALLGALIYSITFPVLLINRVGFETTISAMSAMLFFLCLTLALRSNRRRHFVLAGLALGLTLYTYYSARLLPAAAVISLGWVALIAGRFAWKHYFKNLMRVAAAAVIAFAPLGSFFILNPSTFFTRVADTSTQTLGQGLTALPLHLLNSALRTAASISVNGFGDFIPRHNLPWRAVYDNFLSLLFWIGVIVLLRNFRWRSAAVLLTWAGVMLLPVILTMEKNSPHYTRMQSALPALAGIGAVGALTFFDALQARSRAWAVGLLGLGLFFSASVTAYDYFGRWANDPALFDAFQVGDWRAANFALDQSTAHTVFVSPDLLIDPAHAAFNVLLHNSPVQSFHGPDCLVYYDHPTRPLDYVVDELNDKHTTDRLYALFPQGNVRETIMHEPEPWLLWRYFEAPAGAAAVPPVHPVTASFGNQLKLLGYNANPETFHRGDAVTFTFYWQATQSLDADYNVFIHLYAPGAINTPLAQSDGAPCHGTYTTSRMEAGEIIIDERTLTIPADFAPASAALGLGLYGWPSLQRLPVNAPPSALLPENRLHLATMSIEP